MLKSIGSYVFCSLNMNTNPTQNTVPCLTAWLHTLVRTKTCPSPLNIATFSTIMAPALTRSTPRLPCSYYTTNTKSPLHLWIHLSSPSHKSKRHVVPAKVRRALLRMRMRIILRVSNDVTLCGTAYGRLRICNVPALYVAPNRTFT